MPAELCNAVATLYDKRFLLIEGADVSFMDSISRRNQHAKQAVLFVEMRAVLQTSEDEYTAPEKDVETY